MERKTLEKHVEKNTPNLKKVRRKATSSVHLNGKTKPAFNMKPIYSYLKEHTNNTNVAIGAVATAMSVAGVVAYLLLNQKHNKKHSGNYFYNHYQDYKDNAEEMAHDVYEKGRKIYDYASDYGDNVRNRAYKVLKQPHSGSLLLLGAASGLMVGGTIAYLLSRHSHNPSFYDKVMDTVDNFKESANNFTEHTTDWIETAKDVLDSVSETIGQTKSSKASNFNVQSAIDLGMTGYKIWESFMKRR